jgi:acetylornithine deacetylase/succinyl-diaminopimelate desuccinylase-like protein
LNTDQTHEPRNLYAAIDREAASGEADAIALLRRLIRTPSLSGAEGNASDPESVPGQIAIALAAEPGVCVEIDTVSTGRDSVVGLLGNGPRLFVLDAHTDTVPTGDPGLWHGGAPYAAVDGVAEYLGDRRIRLTVGSMVVERAIRPRLARLWEARGNASQPVIYGRGSVDNKGPVAVALYATQILARVLDQAGLRLAGTLVSAFPVDEELDMAGTRQLFGGEDSWLARTGFLPESLDEDGLRDGIAGIALDGSYGFVPVIGHRGIAQLLVSTRGQAAHAATPDLGVNAVTLMARALAILDQERDEVARQLAPLFSDDILEPATLALGTTIVGGGINRVGVEGGARQVDRAGTNVVSDWCEATIDCRYPRLASNPRGVARDAIADILQAYLRERLGALDGTIAVEPLGGGPPCTTVTSLDAANSDPVIQSVLRHGEQISGFTPWIETAPGGTDATVMINEGRIRTLVEFGPAGAFSHEPHEFVERDQIAIGARILARTIVDWLGVEPAT